MFAATALLTIPTALSSPAPLPTEPLPTAPAQTVEDTSSAVGQFSYDYVEGTIGFGDSSGFTLEGSYQIDGPWLVVASLRFLEADVPGGDVDFDVIRVGGGYIHELQDGLDIIGTAEIEFVDADIPGADSETGLFLRGGARYQASTEIEAFGGLALRTNDDLIDQTLVIDLGGRYPIDEHFSAVAMIEIDDDTMFSLGVRYDI